MALFGSQGYGQRVGKATAIRLAAAATAPSVGAFLMQHVGSTLAFIIASGLALAAVE
ncbi:hypothetical protein [Phyllobacterium sp. K27]